LPEHGINQGGLSVVDVGNDGYVSNVVTSLHGNYPGYMGVEEARDQVLGGTLVANHLPHFADRINNESSSMLGCRARYLKADGLPRGWPDANNTGWKWLFWLRKTFNECHE
jgi:hypothetical protein